jgi:O-antigen/teichoic acid export membrane protein
VSLFRRLLSALTRDSPFLITVANFAALGMALVTAPVVARALGPEGRGETTAALAAFAIVPIVLAVGIPLEIRWQAARGNADAAVRASRDLWLMCIPPAALIALSLDHLVFSGLEQSARWAAFIGVALAPISMSWASDISLLIARGHYRGVMVIRLIQPVVFLFGALLLWAADALTVTLVLALNVLATAITATVSWRLAGVRLRGARSSYRELLRGGVKYAGSSIAETASNRLDQVLVLPLLGAFGAGLYSVAVTIGTLPLAVGHALGATYFRSVAASGPEDRTNIVAEGVRATSSLAILVCVGLALLTPPAIGILFGGDFSDAVKPTWIVLVGSVGLTVGYVCSMMLAAQGHGARMTIAQLASLAAAVVLLYCLGPIFGVLGASVASSLSYAVLLAVLLVSLQLPIGTLLPTPRGIVIAIRRLFGR